MKKVSLLRGGWWWGEGWRLCGVRGYDVEMEQSLPDPSPKIRTNYEAVTLQIRNPLRIILE